MYLLTSLIPEFPTCRLKPVFSSVILWADDYWPFEHRQKIQVDNPIISSNFGLTFLTLLSHFRHFFLFRRSLMLQNWFWISLTGYEGHLCCQFVFWHFYLITKVNYAVNFIFGTFNPFWRSVMLPIFCMRTFGTRDIQIFVKIVDFG